ncbi:hypothetical protein [Kineococcus glutinatus]|uniref:Uncharacterized protein n=1 Tax=Kineococcus glutinatus TaxID=1070872 RepID=A0ABP9I1M9_9ACTN
MSDTSPTAARFAGRPRTTAAAQPSLRPAAIVSAVVGVVVLAGILEQLYVQGGGEPFAVIGALVGSSLAAILLLWNDGAATTGSRHRDRIRVGIRAACWLGVVGAFAALIVAV